MSLLIKVSKDSGILLIMGSGLAPITTGIKAYEPCPFNGLIESVELEADQVGNIVVDIWRDSYANFPPTVADTICGGNKPTINAAQKYKDVALAGWTLPVNKGDVFGFNVDSILTITQCTLMLGIRKT